MKILSIILAVLLTVVLLLGVALQMFLTKGLTKALNQNVFPAVKSMYGLDMSITNASVNLLKGTAELDGFAVRNLKGYEEPYLLTFDKCLLEVEMMSLIKRDPVVIKLAKADGAILVIERNKAKTFNVKELADALKPVESKEPAVPEAPSQTPDSQTNKAPQSEPSLKPAAKPVPVHIRRIAINTLVKYSDSGRKENYDLSLRLTGSDLFTMPAADHPSSLLVLRGSLAHEKTSFVVDMNTILEPLIDPKNPTFNATGSILDIDPAILGNLLKKNDMESSSFSIKPSVTCTKGQLKGSYINVVLNDFKIYGTKIGDTTLKLPLNGSLKHPSLDITGALQSLFSEQGLKIGKAVGLKELKKQLGVDTNATTREMIIGGLTNNVKEVAESPALQQLIEQVTPGAQTNAAATNQPLGESIGEALSEQLGKNIKELKDNDAVKESLKSLGNSLFGK